MQCSRHQLPECRRGREVSRSRQPYFHMGTQSSPGLLFSIQWNMGITGIWIAFIIDEWIRGLLMVIRWRQGKWRDIRLAVLG